MCSLAMIRSKKQGLVRSLSKTGSAPRLTLVRHTPLANFLQFREPIKCINDLERLYFTIENGKVSEVTVIALGSLSGIVGLYIQIGGKLEI